jgi:hypothetical protein
MSINIEHWQVINLSTGSVNGFAEEEGARTMSPHVFRFHLFFPKCYPQLQRFTGKAAYVTSFRVERLTPERPAVTYTVFTLFCFDWTHGGNSGARNYTRSVPFFRAPILIETKTIKTK